MWICASCSFQLHPDAVATGAQPRAWCPRCFASGAWVPGGVRSVGTALAAAERPTTAADVCRRSWALTNCPETGLAWAPPALALPFAFYASEILSEWLRRPGAMRVALALGLFALAACAATGFAFDVVFPRPELPGLPWRAAGGS